jgi:chromosome segregation ATPase
VGIIANGTPQGALAPDTANSSESIYDLDRLEDAIASLVDQNSRLREERAAIRGELNEKAKRVQTLEGQLLEANQRRQDVAKRIDELVAQMDSLDAQLEAAESAAEEGA